MLLPKTREIELNAHWRAHEGSQTAFLSSQVYECMYSGTRGPGKSDSLLMAFARHVGKGHGQNWRGIIFRKHFKNLDELRVKGEKLFRPVYPDCQFLRGQSNYKFIWSTGEELLLRHAEITEDYWNYHGHEYPFVGFDELTAWPDGELYDAFHSICRSSTVGIPKMYRSTSNPYGPGHNWVKLYWWDPAPIISKKGIGIREKGVVRMRFDGDLMENKHLIAAQPEYLDRLNNLKNEAMRKAWRFGDWEINVGAFFGGYWDPKVHIVDDFVPPLDWPRWRSMDWGFSSPFAIAWYAQDYDKRIYMYREMYGWSGKPNEGARLTAKEVAKRVFKIEALERKSGVHFLRNPADHDLWAKRGSEQSPEELMRGEGVGWMKASKGPGSRVTGWDIYRTFLEEKEFFVTKSCRHFIRTVPVLMPDEDNPDDVDTDMEDHMADCTRYGLVSRHRPRHRPEKKKVILPMSFDEITQKQVKADKPKGIRVTRR